MDFWTSVKVLAKRWYIVVAGLVLTLAGAFGLNTLIAPSYTAAGSAVLSVPPNLPERAVSSNPYLAYGNLSVAAKVVASAMNQPSVVRDLRGKGASGTFVVDLDPERSSPIITVTSRAHTATAAIRTVDVVTQGVQQLLADRQRSLGAPMNTWLTADTVVVPEEANRAIGSRLRAISAVVVLGLLATLALAFAVEGWAQSRDRDAAPPRVPPPAPVPDSPPEPPAPVGMCPLCRAPFVTAEALARHLAQEHDVTDRPPPPPTPPAPDRQPEGDVLASRLRALRSPDPPTADPTPPAPPATRAPRAKKATAASPRIRARKSTPPPE